MLKIELKSDAPKGVVDLIKEQGLIVPNSCNDGRCGACIGTLISGNLNREKPEVFLAENPTRDAFLACCCSLSAKVLVSFQNLYPDIFPEPRHIVGKIRLFQQISANLAVFRIRLRPGSKFKFVPGQHIGISTADIAERYYSIASYDECADHIDVLVAKVAGGEMSDFLFGHTTSEQTVTLNGPIGSFHLPDAHCDGILAFVTGSGLGPILSILDKMTFNSDPRLKNFSICWGYRNIADGDILLESLYPEVNFYRFCSRGDDPRAIGSYLTEFDFDGSYNPNSLYLACGNPKMVVEINEKLRAKGFEMAKFSSDNFLLRGDFP